MSYSDTVGWQMLSEHLGESRFPGDRSVNLGEMLR